MFNSSSKFYSCSLLSLSSPLVVSYYQLCSYESKPLPILAFLKLFLTSDPKKPLIYFLVLPVPELINEVDPNALLRFDSSTEPVKLSDLLKTLFLRCSRPIQPLLIFLSYHSSYAIQKVSRSCSLGKIYFKSACSFAFPFYRSVK